ncbi:MAG TPA: hypothetical protein VF365_06495 [Candidatus Limnocylindria bacterium]
MSRGHRALVPLAVLLLLAACAPSEPVATSSSRVASVPSEPARSSGDPSSAPATTGAAEPSPSQSGSADPLLAATFTDVRSGEQFSLGELAEAAGPVLLEPMAVWCSSCRAQQHEVKRAHDLAEFASVSLDVDLSETPDDLAAYADREGFDWRFVMADASLYRLLQERFGVAATNPPSTPLIVIDRDGSVRPLEFGRGTRSADQLVAEIQEG